MRGLIVGVDPGNKTGCAVWSRGDDSFIYSALHDNTPTDTELDTERWVSYVRMLNTVIDERMACLALEDVKGHRGRKAAQVYGGYRAMALYSRHIYAPDAAVCLIHPNTLKKWATGNARATKADMVKEAKRLKGLTSHTGKLDHNVADAALLAKYADEHEEEWR